MTVTEQNIVIRKLQASEGKVITDVDTQMMRATVVYLGCEENQSNYIEIDADTPIPQAEESLPDIG